MSNYFGFISGGGSGGGGGLTYKGNWDALLNIPPLASGVGVNGDYYVVSVAGNTNLDGITNWQIGDWAIFNGTVWQKIDNSVTSPNVRTATFGCTVNGGGFAPLVGIIGYTVIPYNGTITGWNIVSDIAGSCVIDVWKANGVVPTVANTIAGTEKPTLIAQQLNSDNALTTWTIAVTSGDVIGFYLDSASTLTSVNLIITILKT
jgi:hypothetical protein